jgi:hypothetical protein
MTRNVSQSILIECPYCLRKFNQVAGERHIPVCKDARHRAKLPPTKAELEFKAEQRRQSVKRNISSKRKPSINADLELNEYMNHQETLQNTDKFETISLSKQSATKTENIKRDNSQLI